MAPELVAGQQVSIARLHGRACWYCGTVTTKMKPAGTVTLAGTTQEWPVVSCGCSPIPGQRQEEAR
ncbi:hypothetical protein ACFXHD_13805 [Streptomyces hydrogenans]|uniref:hypothetical protein n=1 Tax=Streptomyces hydrogenans TaxID=1873719 RepID=UPI0036CB892D